MSGEKIPRPAGILGCENMDTEHGNVVAIAHNSKLNYDIHYSIRLVDTSDYNIPNYDTLRGFLVW